MAKLPPLRNLRKTTIVVIGVLLFFLIYHIATFAVKKTPVQDTAQTELTKIESLVCSHIANGETFGVDSVFVEGTRLYILSTINSNNFTDVDTLVHIWFNGVDTIQKSICTLSANNCHTSVDSKLVKPGNWSVDLVHGRKLLSSRQFLVEPARR